jgi:hypothetical protein
MRKKFVIVSHLSDRLPSLPARRILLSRETIRTLTSVELSQVAGGNDDCKTGSVSNNDGG